MRRSETTLLAFLGILAVVGTIWVAGSVGADNVLVERREQVRQMSPEEKARLLANKERFDRLPDAEKERLLQAHDKLTAESDSAELRGVLQRYDQWLSELSITESNSVRSMPPEKRVEKIKKLRKKQLQTQIDKQVREMVLAPKDWQVIRNWWTDFVRRNEAMLVAKLPPQVRASINNLSPEQRQQRLQWIALAQRKSHGRWKPPVKPTANDVQKLVGQLSPAARKRLEKFNSPDKQLQMVIGWIQSAVRRNMRSEIAPYVEPKELQRFFDEQLTPAEQAKLKQMPEQARRRELTKRYFKAKVNKWKPGPRPGPHRPGRPSGDKSKSPGGPDHRRPGDRE